MSFEIKINTNSQRVRSEKESQVNYFKNPGAWKLKKIGATQTDIPRQTHRTSTR
jgi:hypothetical protein